MQDIFVVLKRFLNYEKPVAFFIRYEVGTEYP